MWRLLQPASHPSRGSLSDLQPNPCSLHVPPSCSKGTFAQMFLDLLRDEGCGEEWRLYFAFQGQLPSEEELRELKGVVITGSV